MQDLDDNALLRDYVDCGSEEAFAALVARHVNKVYSVALRHTSNPDSAGEITQVVFVILAKKSRGLGKGVVLSGWLYQAARLASVTFIRSEVRRARRQQEAHMQTLANESNDEAWTQIAPLLDVAMADLNEKDRHAVVLRFFDRKSMKEVGDAMGLTEDATKKRVSRALDKLRKYFARRGVNSTTAIIGDAVSANSVQLAPAGLAKIAVATAVAKNAAAGGSTLTLTKGALKLMAWTKAKTAIVVGASVLFATGATTVVVKHTMGSSSGGDPSWANDPRSWELNSQVLEKLPSAAFILRATQFPNDGGGVSTGQRFLWKNVTVQTLIATAYRFPETRIVFPTNLPRDRSDLLSTMQDHPEQLLQDQIKKRFGLMAHTENREVDVFRLRVSNPNPPKLKLHSGNDNNSSWMGSDRKATIKNEALGGFFGNVESQIGRPVLDETGLTGRYDLEFDWHARPGESKDQAYHRALLEQLGLELVPDRAAIEELVVEKVN